MECCLERSLSSTSLSSSNFLMQKTMAIRYLILTFRQLFAPSKAIRYFQSSRSIYQFMRKFYSSLTMKSSRQKRLALEKLLKAAICAASIVFLRFQLQTGKIHLFIDSDFKWKQKSRMRANRLEFG